MDLSEVSGYVAAGLVLATFTMRTMIPLRLLGIASNVAFIVYGATAEIVPVLILHAILLPLNALPPRRNVPAGKGGRECRSEVDHCDG